MKSYNGHSGVKRTEVGNALTVRFKAGELPKPTLCVLCGTTHGRIDAHLEDYDQPETYVPLCWRCHLALHSRFHNPDGWEALLHKLGPDARALASRILSPWPVCFRGRLLTEDGHIENHHPLHGGDRDAAIAALTAMGATVTVELPD